MSSLEARRMQSKPTNRANPALKIGQDVHADPELFHELVEEPDLVFADDKDALGVAHAGQPDTATSVRKTVAAGKPTRQPHQGKRQLGRTDPDIHADPALFHELVEEPDLVFAEDIDALGVTHAGTPD
ncbi:hypothetical protein V493_06012 [Pseudogymnoascus sp. VKM F-4281 (FW-2241)]|nr:hypothetical protein V493_06012 [Pseudogymnoascus sp. VKM F-4281 (FW-2241)]